MITATTNNPFDLPELRHRLSRVVAVKDTLSCALVSKAWAETFVPVVWFKVDLKVQPLFTVLSPRIIAKHGNHIRTAINVKTLPHVSALANAGVNRLRYLHIEASSSALQHVRAYEIISRNCSSLKKLQIFVGSVPTNKQDAAAHYVNVHALIPPSGAGVSRIDYLSIKHQCLTHDGFVTILQGCPALLELKLNHTKVIGNPTISFQHTGIQTFGSTLKSLFQDPSAGPSLLSYFPSLKTLHVISKDATFSVLSARIKEDLSRYCPHLIGFRLEGSTGTIVPKFTSIADTASKICFTYKHLSLETITAILLHQATLTTIEQFHFDFEKDEVPTVSDHFQEAGRFLQLIPKSCSHLATFILPSHEMDMDEVEKGEWVCKDLKSLRIRIKGLDTEEKILKAIAMWRKGCWRRWQDRAGTPVGEEGRLDANDMSIEARVARHLLNFDKLWWVWLGYQTWMPI
ncbi:hypothetical protein BGW39_007711 [Mortierella sp. 14UC]|nr:hypothetical protein BGW39_007711 [Mortierella sp. 14UC]